MSRTINRYESLLRNLSPHRSLGWPGVGTTELPLSVKFQLSPRTMEVALCTSNPDIDPISLMYPLKLIISRNPTTITSPSQIE